MDVKQPQIVDLAQAIRITNVRLRDVLAQHAERVGELDTEDPAPTPRPAYSFISERAASPLPPPDSTPKRPKRQRPLSPESPVVEVDDQNAESHFDPSSNVPLPHAKKKKRPEKHKGNRQAKRAQIQAVDGHTLKACALKRVLDTIPVPVDVSLEMQAIPVASTGWMGRRDSTIENAATRAAESAAQTGDCVFQQHEIPPQRFLERHEALAEPGMRLITAEMQGPTTAIVDADDRVIIILNCGPTGATDWKGAVNDASTAMDEAAKSLYGPDYDKQPLERHDDCPRRGPHYAVNLGTGMGGGQQQPTPFSLHDSVSRILMALLLHHAIARFVGTANVLFQMYAPKLYEYYPQHNASAAQVGPKPPPACAPCLMRVCVRYIQFWSSDRHFSTPRLLNLAWGWCFITALGWYDYRKGGHLIIWDLRLMIEFPPGATFAIPSAYTSAGVFRFVNNGFKTNVTLEQEMTKEEAQAWADAAKRAFM
ncbi:hypothetical protein B0H14DRAFT_3447554 [Mycena olivaceomarginata]|nr:hypothetical protein B0H14DRAFT_3447554 [Mycena olivaceomarginata]